MAHAAMVLHPYLSWFTTCSSRPMPRPLTPAACRQRRLVVVVFIQVLLRLGAVTRLLALLVGELRQVVGAEDDLPLVQAVRRVGHVEAAVRVLHVDVVHHVAVHGAGGVQRARVPRRVRARP